MPINMITWGKECFGDNNKDREEEIAHLEDSQDIGDNINNDNLSKYKTDDNMKYRS